MQFTISSEVEGKELYLADKYSAKGDSRYYLLLKTKPCKLHEVYMPHEIVRAAGLCDVAGNLVLEWMRETGRTDSELLAARSFFGWDITELSANQLQFITEAEEAGLTVDFSYVPENSYGRTCPAVAPKDYCYFLKSPLFVEMAVSGTELWIFARD